MILISLKENAMILSLSHGFADQFGGPHEKKYSYKRFRNLLLSGCALPLDVQGERLDTTIVEWIGGLSEIDALWLWGSDYSVPGLSCPGCVLGVACSGLQVCFQTFAPYFC